MRLGRVHDLRVHGLPAYRPADRAGLQLVESVRAPARSWPAPRDPDQAAAPARRRDAANRTCRAEPAFGAALARPRGRTEAPDHTRRRIRLKNYPANAPDRLAS